MEKIPKIAYKLNFSPKKIQATITLTRGSKVDRRAAFCPPIFEQAYWKKIVAKIEQEKANKIPTNIPFIEIEICGEVNNL